MEGLKFIRIMTPYHIPKKYIEQLKGVDFSAERFYQHLERHCTIPTSQGPTLNPLVHLYVLANEENIVKGFLYFVIDDLTQDIVIQNFSVAPEFWNKGDIINFMKEHVLMVHEKAKLNKIYWITRSAAHSEKHGFKRSRHVLMEHDPNQKVDLKPLSVENEVQETEKSTEEKKPVKKAKKKKENKLKEKVHGK